MALLDNEAKMFAGLLLEDLQTWVEEKSAIPLHQTGFAKSVGTTTNILSMAMLMDKAEAKRMSLYLCFIDYKAAFDHVNRTRLWSKLHSWGLPQPLLNLLINLHTDTWLQVKLGNGTLLLRRIPTEKGLKQGCVLAPTLFNLYIADLVPFPNSCNSHAPKLGDI